MIAYLLYNKNTPGERQSTELHARLEKEQVDSELLDADSPRGSAMAESYDVMARPAVILLKNDGAPLQIWQGEDGLPPASEIGYLARQ